MKTVKNGAPSRLPEKERAQEVACRLGDSIIKTALAGVLVTSATCKRESRRNLKPTKPAVQISDADRKRRILITDKRTTTFEEWREKGESSG
jgi:hypothetical protein